MRLALGRLSDVARRRGCAIIGLRHLNKSGGGKAMYRGGGSIGITAHVRSALVVGPHPDDDQLRVLAPVKTNRGRMPKARTFRLVPVPVTIGGVPDEICRVDWVGEVDLKADQLVAGPLTDQQREEHEHKLTKAAQAEGLLKSLLKDGALPVEECKAAAEKLGIGESTVEKASKKIGVVLTFGDKQKGTPHTWGLTPYAFTPCKNP
jgi:hypothetical protein